MTVEFLHPSISSRIIDNSYTYITAQGLTTLYAAFAAERGPDNKPQLITSESEFLFYYGAPNIRKYGQAGYNVARWLASGGQAICVRVLPYEAIDGQRQSTYACAIVEVGCADTLVVEPWTADTYVNEDEVYSAGTTPIRYYKVTQAGTTDDTAPTHITGSAVNGTATFLFITAPTKAIKVRTRTLGDGLKGIDSADKLAVQDIEKAVRDDASLQTIVLATPEEPEEDGFIYYPIMVFRGRDRGKFYNDFGGIRLELTGAQDETYAHRLYELTVFGTESAALERNFLVSTYPEATDISGLSQFVVDVINNYSAFIRCSYSEDNYDLVCAYINSNATVAKKLDIFTLKDRDVRNAESLHSACVIQAGSADLSPTPEMAFPLGGGVDGTWEDGNALEALLYKAYSGSGDFTDPVSGINLYDTHFSDLWDKKAYPIDVCLDANYPVSVKVAMSNFAQTRGDFMSFVDVGFTSSPQQALTYRNTQLTISSFYTGIFGQDFIVYDQYNGRDIRVTPTYFLAEKIPSVDYAYGIHWPFVGPRRGTIAGQKDISWVPNGAYRELLYKARVNYVERDTEKTAFMTQNTSQLLNSALTDISHCRALLRIRRDVEAISQQAQFEFNDERTWDALQYSINNYMSRWVSNRALRSASAMVYASEYDKLQRIVHVVINVQFTGLIERVMIDLIVNR
jgi:hypothetical protein